MKAFVSYSSVDKDLARRVAEQIRVRGWDAWIDETGLSPGDELAASLAQSLGDADVFVLVLTAASAASNWVRYELNRILPRLVNDGVKVIPLRFDDVDVPPALQGVVYGDCRSDAGLRKALNAVFASSEVCGPMRANELEARLRTRTIPQYCIRLMPEADFTDDGHLGPDERDYVCVGDYFENCGRSLRQILSDLLRGRDMDEAGRPDERWLAVVFEVGERYRREYDIMPATWKAVFRIVTDRRRLGLATPSEQDIADLGPRPRDYYSGSGDGWYDRARGILGGFPEDEEILKARFGIVSMCFTGNGTGGEGRRVFFLRNLPLDNLGYTVQNMGVADNGIILA